MRVWENQFHTFIFTFVKIIVFHWDFWYDHNCINPVFSSSWKPSKKKCKAKIQTTFSVKPGHRLQNTLKRMPKISEFTEETKEGSRKKLRGRRRKEGKKKGQWKGRLKHPGSVGLYSYSFIVKWSARVESLGVWSMLVSLLLDM